VLFFSIVKYKINSQLYNKTINQWYKNEIVWKHTIKTKELFKQLYKFNGVYENNKNNSNYIFKSSLQLFIFVPYIFSYVHICMHVYFILLF